MQIVSPKFIKYCSILRTERKKFPIMLDDDIAICLVIPQRMRLSGTVMEIWRLKDNGVTTLTFWGHVTSSVTWPFDSRKLTSYGWSIVTMHLPSTITEIWPFEVLPGRLFQEQRSVVHRSVLNITLISYTPLCYIRNIAREK